LPGESDFRLREELKGRRRVVSSFAYDLARPRDMVPSVPMIVTVTLYTRHGCHLCTHATAIILATRSADFVLEEIDIDADPDLRERYTNDVPVVAINGVDVFWHHVDPVAFASEVRRASSTHCDRPAN
jgi:glutaredoxin